MGLLGALAALPATATAELPDLVSLAPSAPYLQVYDGTEGEPQRLLMRFDGFIQNAAGAGDLELAGDVAANAGSATSVRQIVQQGAGQPPLTLPLPGAEMVWEDDAPGALEDGHFHFHFARAAEYSLRSEDGLATIDTAQKVGFCMADTGYMPPTPSSAPKFTDVQLCKHDPPGVDDDFDDVVRMGITPGWLDVYDDNTMYQWVDVSEVRPGPYQLRSVVDPADLIEESVEDNGFGDRPVVVPGYVAKGRIVARGFDGAPAQIGLGYDRFESDFDEDGTAEAIADPEYKLVEAPLSGSVDLTTGWSDDPAVTYTPDAGSSAIDEFTYAVREKGAAFPREPFVATVAITVGEKPVIAIGGAPQQMIAGSSVDLTATPAAESWTASAGSVTPGGRYTAPAEIPESGAVTITAVSPKGAVDKIAIRIILEPKPQPAPAPPDETRGDTLVRSEPNPFVPPTPVAVLPRTRALGRVSASRIGRFVAVSVKAGQPGRLTISLRKGARKVKGCVIDVRAGAAHTCRIRRPRGERAALKVVVSMRKRTGGAVTRTIALKAPPRARASAHRH